MQIKQIELNNKQIIDLGKLTVLIGPNNVGKSQTLRDIRDIFMVGVHKETILVKNIKCAKINIHQMVEHLAIIETNNLHNKQVWGLNPNLNESQAFSTPNSDLDAVLTNTDADDVSLTQLGKLARYHIAYLNADSRLQLSNRKPIVEHEKHTVKSLLHKMYYSGSEAKDPLESLKIAFNNTFNKDIDLDYSKLTEMCFRVSDKFETKPRDVRKQIDYFKNIPKLDDQGDGFRSFVSILLGLLLTEDRVILIDEPEAFLHPSQIRSLARWIGEYSHTISGQIIISTHNYHFINGIISASNTVDIFRLNREANNTQFTKLSSESIKNLANSPILNSQRVMEALFYRAVVVCEADTDRILYSTVARKDYNDEEVFFIHAHNKQTIHIVIDLLTSANIPCCSILDIDILNGHTDIEKLLKSFGYDLSEDYKTLLKRLKEYIDGSDDEKALNQLQMDVKELLHQLNEGEHNFSGARGAINRIRNGLSKWSNIKKNGISELPDDLENEITDFIKELSAINIFVAPVGELESWIDVGTTKKNKWIVSALKFLNETETPIELKDFIGKIIDKLINGS